MKECLQGFRAGARANELMPLGAQHGFEGEKVLRPVVDEQHGGAFGAYVRHS